MTDVRPTVDRRTIENAMDLLKRWCCLVALPALLTAGGSAAQPIASGENPPHAQAHNDRGGK